VYKTGNGLEDELVVTSIEIRGRDQIGHTIPCGGVEHEPAEHGLFGLYGMRRNA